MYVPRRVVSLPQSIHPYIHHPPLCVASPRPACASSSQPYGCHPSSLMSCVFPRHTLRCAPLPPSPESACTYTRSQHTQTTDNRNQQCHYSARARSAVGRPFMPDPHASIVDGFGTRLVKVSIGSTCLCSAEVGKSKRAVPQLAPNRGETTRRTYAGRGYPRAVQRNKSEVSQRPSALGRPDVEGIDLFIFTTTQVHVHRCSFSFNYLAYAPAVVYPAFQLNVPRLSL